MYRKTRTFLTLLGIIIGIFAIFSLVTISQGMRNSIVSQFEKIGADKIIIMPGKGLIEGSMLIKKFSESEFKEIKKISGVKEATYYLMRIAKVNYGDKSRYVYVIGIPTDKSRKIIEDMQNYQITEGRDLESGDNYRAVVGYLYTTKRIFNKEMKINDRIRISNKKFKVVGFLNPIGNNIDDSSILIPVDIAKKIFEINDTIDWIFVQVHNKDEIYGVVDKIEKKLRKLKNLKEGEEDFSVVTTDDLIESFNKILTIVDIVLVTIASISLVVGGIGIMNTTFTSVLERKKEIAIMKSIGAKKYYILTIFLLESGLTALIGGMIGVVLGYIITKLIEIVTAKYLKVLTLMIRVDIKLIIFVLLFSFFIGVISGIAPAWKASKLKPVEGLRL